MKRQSDYASVVAADQSRNPAGDEEDILRTDHKISFVGLTILRLHYKMTLVQDATDSSADARRSVDAEQTV